MENKILNIRSYGWLADNLSWTNVITELINAFDALGHNSYVLSTNGMNQSLFTKKNKMIDSVLALQDFGPGKKSIDLDFCFTVPQNFPQRFLKNSKVKAAIYAYEYLWWPPAWKQYYKYIDMMFAPSDFGAEVFYNNGVPIDKIFVAEHGVNPKKFNSSIPAMKLKTDKSYRFLSICAPHYRKKLHILLDAYCRAFKKSDDVCLVLKTKMYKHSDGEWNDKTNPKGRKGFEVVLGDIFKELYQKYGKNIPSIEIIDRRIDELGGLYNSCNTFVSTPSSECFLIPACEALFSGGITGKGMLNIAPFYSGQLQFANDTNSLLIDTKLVKAKSNEQYWGLDDRNMSGEPNVDHTAELMLLAYKNYDALLEKFRPGREKIMLEFTWDSAAQKMIDIIDGKIEHYIPGTYNWWPK